MGHQNRRKIGPNISLIPKEEIEIWDKSNKKQMPVESKCAHPDNSILTVENKLSGDREFCKACGRYIKNKETKAGGFK